MHSPAASEPTGPPPCRSDGVRQRIGQALAAASRAAPRLLTKLSKTLGVSIALATFAVSAQAPLDVRVALIIGNSAYIGAPVLGNPANDARAMGEVLRSLGFQVIELRDGNKAQMTAAISRVQESLKGKQAVAMLYYAGHGLQLDWRNYMVPVDARLASAADVPRQTIDLGSVIDTFKGAGTRMNIMVLDACRDNPFASSTSSAKGLAQLDAPPGTFLAYATAPGNVAEDGDEKGGNGMYTQYLLLELRKPFGKIEDVFKRVRLSVRQKTQGRQTPWESTSLEEDFFFNDGTRLATKPEELTWPRRPSETNSSYCSKPARPASANARLPSIWRKSARPRPPRPVRPKSSAAWTWPGAKKWSDWPRMPVCVNRRDWMPRSRHARKSAWPRKRKHGNGSACWPRRGARNQSAKRNWRLRFHRRENWRPGANRT